MKPIQKNEGGDFVINFFQWNVIWRPLISTLGGVVVASGLYLFIQIGVWFGIFNHNFISWWMWLAIVALIVLAVIRDEEDAEGNPLEEVVPETAYQVLITWFGMVVSLRGANFYRTSGRYRWTGRRLGFDRSRKVLELFTLAEPGQEGILLGETIPIEIWNAPDSKNISKSVEALARNEARVNSGITLLVKARKPVDALNFQDPLLAVANRMRQEYREVIGHFNDSDVLALAPHLKQIMLGQKILFCYLHKSVGMVKAGSMLRDMSGVPMFVLLPQDADEGAAIQAFTADVIAKADTKQWQSIKRKVAGVDSIKVEVKYVENTITQAVDAIGYDIVDIIFSDIKLSPKVVEAAEEASAEAKQREAELEDARTKKEARQVLLPTRAELANPGFELAQILAAQRGGNKQAQVVYTAGGNNPLVAAAVAGASQLQGGSK